jgi:hypothetical protein
LRLVLSATVVRFTLGRKLGNFSYALCAARRFLMPATVFPSSAYGEASLANCSPTFWHSSSVIAFSFWSASMSDQFRLASRGWRFNVFGEFDTDRFEANEICFEGHWIRHLVCVTPDRFAGIKDSSMVFVSRNYGQKRMLDDECAFHCVLLPIRREVKTTMALKTVQSYTGSSRLAV